MRSLAPLAFLAPLLALAAPAARADTSASPDRVIHYSAEAMGTVVNVTIWGDDEEKAARAARAVFDEFRRVDRLMTSWEDDSAVSRINRAAGERAVKVPGEVFEVIALAQKMARKTGGAFDVTVGAFRGLWKFDEDLDRTIPDREQIERRLERVGHRGLRLFRKGKRVKLRRRGMRITLGGIAKGYAVDRAVKILHDMDLVDFIIQAGGDLYVSGRKGSRKWRVGIRDPRGARDATFAIAEIQDRTFSTSGDYERAFVEDGVRYHHILDPETGRPARKSRSVTVMADSALSADVWSTALFVIGAGEGMKLVEKIPGLEAVFIDAENQVHVSGGLEDVVLIHKQPTAGL